MDTYNIVAHNLHAPYFVTDNWLKAPEDVVGMALAGRGEPLSRVLAAYILFFYENRYIVSEHDALRLAHYADCRAERNDIKELVYLFGLIKARSDDWSDDAFAEEAKDIISGFASEVLDALLLCSSDTLPAVTADASYEKARAFFGDDLEACETVGQIANFPATAYLYYTASAKRVSLLIEATENTFCKDVSRLKKYMERYSFFADMAEKMMNGEDSLDELIEGLRHRDIEERISKL